MVDVNRTKTETFALKKVVSDDPDGPAIEKVDSNKSCVPKNRVRAKCRARHAFRDLSGLPETTTSRSRTSLKAAQWNWAGDPGKDEAAGYSGSYTAITSFLTACKRNGLPDNRYDQLFKAVKYLSRRQAIEIEDSHYIGDQNTVDVFASAGVMNVKQVAANLKSISKGNRQLLQDFMTQAEMLHAFKERIMEHGQIMHKKEPAMIRPAVNGERVVTTVGGRVTSDVVVQDTTSWVVKAPTEHQEEYVLPGLKFEANWLAEGSLPTPTCYRNPGELEKQGFKLHYPKLKLKWTYMIQSDDLCGLSSNTLKTEWGALQTIISGDYLALPYPEAEGTEIYIMPHNVVKGVYQLYLDAAPAINAQESISGNSKSSSGSSPWQPHSIFEAMQFNRATRGDIAHDTKAILRAFQEPYNLLFRYQMEEEALAKWIQSIAEQYNGVPYHSWEHAFDVFQFIYSSLTAGGSDEYFHFQDILALLLGALSHDVGHMGTTNNFHISTQSQLAIKYNDKSPLENMHASTFFETLQKPGLNFLSAMSPDNFRSFRPKVVDSILATDMSHHFELIDKLSVRVMQAKDQDMPVVTIQKKDEAQACEGDLMLLLQSFMHMADLGHCVRPFDIHKQIVVLLEEEFFKQGDEERTLGMPISPMMDRRKDSAATSQSFFLSKLVLPLMTPWTYFLKPEAANHFIQALVGNRETWEALVAEHIPPGAEVKTAKAIVSKSSNALGGAALPTMPVF